MLKLRSCGISDPRAACQALRGLVYPQVWRILTSNRLRQGSGCVLRRYQMRESTNDRAHSEGAHDRKKVRTREETYNCCVPLYRLRMDILVLDNPLEVDRFEASNVSRSGSG